MAKKGKQKKRKIHSFANRLSWWLMLTLLVSMGCVSYLVYVLAVDFVEEEEGHFHATYCDFAVEEMRQSLSEFYVGVGNRVPEVEECLDSPNRLFALMERIVRENKRVHSCGLSFVADYYPNRGRWFCPYAVRRDSVSVEVFDMGGSKNDYLNQEWFASAMQQDSGHWSKPFFEAGNDSVPLVAYLLPIYDSKGRKVAILGADLSLDWLNERMEDITWDLCDRTFYAESRSKTEENENSKRRARLLNPYCIIVNRDGTYLSHPERQRVLKSNLLDHEKQQTDTMYASVCRQIMAGTKGYTGMDREDVTKLDLDGRGIYLFFAPIKDTDWSMVVVAPAGGFRLIGILLGGVLLVLIVLGLIVVNIVSRIVIKRSTKPLKRLALTAEEVAKGRFDTALPPVRHKDEIRLLRDSFETMQHSLTNYIEELKATTAEKVSIERDLQIAHGIQMALLPKTFPPFPNRTDIDLYGMLRPAKDVGGDLFDFFIRDEKLFFCIGDVSGKGVPASLVMAVTRTLFRNVSAHVTAPEKIVAAVNDSLAADNDSSMFVTLFVGVLDIAGGQLLYCNAGHDAPLLIGQGGVAFLPCDPNLPTGIVDGHEYTQQQTMLLPGTTLFLYTDGLNEAEDSQHAQFGEERMTLLARQLLNGGTIEPRQLIDSMEAAVKTFVGQAEQSDDLTMMALQLR